ncbi:MAG: hypothetical protein IT317_17720 [Anaerolineales bacterium]|nr:hypothetical protein [Anaerolineales bacterium]
MTNNANDPLEQAAELLRTSHLGEARALLAAYLQAHPASDEGWYMLSHAVTDATHQRDCLERALHLNPGNRAARERLALLRGEAAPSRPTPPPTSPPADSISTFGSRPTASSVYRPPAEQPPTPSQTIYGAWPTPRPAHEPEPEPEPEPVAESPAAHLRGQLIAPTNYLLTEPEPVTPPRRARDWPMIFLVMFGLLVLAGVGVTTAVLVLRPTPTPVAVVVIENTPVSFPTLPPTWTATLNIPTHTPTPIPTRTPRPSATFEPPNPTQAVQMDKIAEQVADLRGLALQGAPERFLIPRDRVADTLEGLVLDPDRRASLEKELRVLSILGLVKPTYDLVKYALNSSSDSLGGFYIPWTKQMFVIGQTFGGLERFVYSHEFDHALTDQHFDIDAMGVYPNCRLTSQRCAAIRALVEGDATLLMYQWLNQYATPQDYKDFANYRPPEYNLPEEFPPPYVSQELDFPYTYGADFVQYLYNRGRWAEVNKAYERLPESTEQILHPEKYIAHEAPITVTDPSLAEALPAEWVMLEDDDLGEWMTFLILGYGADYEAMLPDDTAWTAANGWGGDHHQVYYQSDLDQTVLAAHWVWDTPRDNTQFADALRDYMDARLRGSKVPRTDGDCWEANNQAGCVFVANGETLWLYAPNQTLINDLLAFFPAFQ